VKLGETGGSLLGGLRRAGIWQPVAASVYQSRKLGDDGVNRQRVPKTSGGAKEENGQPSRGSRRRGVGVSRGLLGTIQGRSEEEKSLRQGVSEEAFQKTWKCYSRENKRKKSQKEKLPAVNRVVEGNMKLKCNKKIERELDSTGAVVVRDAVTTFPTYSTDREQKPHKEGKGNPG